MYDNGFSDRLIRATQPTEKKNRETREKELQNVYEKSRQYTEFSFGEYIRSKISRDTLRKCGISNIDLRYIELSAESQLYHGGTSWTPGKPYVFTGSIDRLSNANEVSRSTGHVGDENGVECVRLFQLDRDRHLLAVNRSAIEELCCEWYDLGNPPEQERKVSFEDEQVDTPSITINGHSSTNGKLVEEEEEEDETQEIDQKKENNQESDTKNTDTVKDEKKGDSVKDEKKGDTVKDEKKADKVKEEKKVDNVKDEKKGDSVKEGKKGDIKGENGKPEVTNGMDSGTNKTDENGRKVIIISKDGNIEEIQQKSSGNGFPAKEKETIKEPKSKENPELFVRREGLSLIDICFQNERESEFYNVEGVAYEDASSGSSKDILLYHTSASASISSKDILLFDTSGLRLKQELIVPRRSTKHLVRGQNGFLRCNEPARPRAPPSIRARPVSASRLGSENGTKSWSAETSTRDTKL